MAEPRHSHPSVLLDFLIVAAGVGLLLLMSRFGVEEGNPATKGGGAILGGIYIVYLGVLFLLSYIFPDRTYVLNLLRYVCEECSIPRSAGRQMGLFYFALGLVVGGWVLLVGFGVVK